MRKEKIFLYAIEKEKGNKQICISYAILRSVCFRRRGSYCALFMAIFRLDKVFCGESLARGLRSSVSFIIEGTVDLNARLPDVVYLAGLIIFFS